MKTKVFGLGKMMLIENLITKKQLLEAKKAQEKNGGRIGYYLEKIPGLLPDKWVQILAKKVGLPHINLEEFEIDPALVGKFNQKFCKKHGIFPVNQTNGKLLVAISDPYSNLNIESDIGFLTGINNVDLILSSEKQIQDKIEQHFNSTSLEKLEEFDIEIDDSGTDKTSEVVDLAPENAGQDARTVELVNKIITNAITKRASDIHIEPHDKKQMCIRYRVDGVMQGIHLISLSLLSSIVARIKVISRLRLDEHRLPQDGRVSVKTKNGKEFDLRVSVLPTIRGEKIVMRILNKDNLQPDLTLLGFETDQLKIFQESLKLPWGMILVTGPTGSGKTTTLYSALGIKNKPEVTIFTAENPVEYETPGITQVQTNDDIGLTFANALRAFLRQDPDIVMVGEIRDFETAETAIQAALTGHLVFSTLHTNDAPSTISRLSNMGVEPFLTSSAVRLVVAQRLVRKICASCREPMPIPPTPEQLKALGINQETISKTMFYHGKGCQKCSKTGYHGRIGVYEILLIDECIQQMILTGASANEIKVVAIQQGMATLRQAAIKKLLRGETTIEEVVKNSTAD